MRRDVLIVGFGLAGWALTESLKTHGISFVVFDPLKNYSSKSATGIFNPIVLKRFRSVWNADAIMEQSIPYYAQSKYKEAFHPTSIYRVLASVSEQNDWAVASDKPDLSRYLSPKIFHNPNANILTPFGMGVVEHTGWIDTNKLLTIAYRELNHQGCFAEEVFDYNALEVSKEKVKYKNIEANHVIFAEGVGIKKNPWFSNLPIVPNKGEWLIVSCKGLELKKILKSSVFVVPLGEDKYRIGATYSREFKNNLPTEKGKAWLIAQFEKLTPLRYELVAHSAGFRPTVPDRKPVIGSHPEYKNLWCVNGLGSRGVLWGPYLAKSLVEALKNTQMVAPALDLTRFGSP
mgnify:FL=1